MIQKLMRIFVSTRGSPGKWAHNRPWGWRDVARARLEEEEAAAAAEKGLAKSCVGMAKSGQTSPKEPFPCQKV